MVSAAGYGCNSFGVTLASSGAEGSRSNRAGWASAIHRTVASGWPIVAPSEGQMDLRARQGEHDVGGSIGRHTSRKRLAGAGIVTSLR